LKRDDGLCFKVGAAVFEVGSVDEGDVKVSLGGGEVDALEAEGEHEGVRVAGDDVHVGGVVFVVDVLVGEDDVFADGVDGGIGEDDDEEDEKAEGDHIYHGKLL